MSLTLQQMRQRVSYDLDQPLTANDIPATGVYWDRSQVNNWIDEGYRLVYARLVDVEAPWLEEEASGAYAASARSTSIRTLMGGTTYDPLKIMGLYDITGAATGYGRQITLIPYQQFSQRRVQMEDVARSQVLIERVGAWWGHGPMQLSLFPVPTSALTIRVRFVPEGPSAAGANGTVTRSITSLDTVIAGNPDSTGNVPISIPGAFHEILVAYAVVKAKQKEESDFRAHERRYMELLDQLVKSADERQQQAARSVLVTDGSDYEDAAVNIYRY